ncbi:hypothetical protein, partial [Paraliomyxa miuraensis]|uniref:hypothetical protein n=1 Tax=Paraliomyxa miuraensis TaxID=376150 RepID=UPI00225B194B
MLLGGFLSAGLTMPALRGRFGRCSCAILPGRLPRSPEELAQHRHHELLFDGSHGCRIAETLVQGRILGHQRVDILGFELLRVVERVLLLAGLLGQPLGALHRGLSRDVLLLVVNRHDTGVVHQADHVLDVLREPLMNAITGDGVHAFRPCPALGHALGGRRLAPRQTTALERHDRLRTAVRALHVNVTTRRAEVLRELGAHAEPLGLRQRVDDLQDAVPLVVAVLLRKPVTDYLRQGAGPLGYPLRLLRPGPTR